MSQLYKNLEVEYEPQEDTLDMEDEMLGLYYNIDSLLSQIQGKMIQFIGSQEGEGTTTLIRAFARVASLKLGKRVLLIDADARMAESDAASQAIIVLNSLIEHKPDTKITDIQEIGGQYSTQSHIAIHTPSLSPIFSSTHVTDFCENLKRQFDLVLIDSLPVSSSPDGLAMARHMDGIILVIEAENTRCRMVENIKNKIIQADGNILGTVFNKQRHYIPPSIYRFL